MGATAGAIIIRRMDKYKVSVHTVERYSVSKRKNTLAPATWVNREDARLSEISQTQKSIPEAESRQGWVPGAGRKGD